MGNGTGSPYKFPNLTAGYISKWIKGAKDHYNLDIDYVGVSNYNVKFGCYNCRHFRFGMNVIMTATT